MKKPNIIIFGVDSLRADHMSTYGYGKNTTPHIDRFAEEAAVFERTYSAHIPTTSGYANMLTGMDCFTTQIVALRHSGEMREGVRTLQEILKDAGYYTSCIGFSGPSARGFDNYLNYEGWGAGPDGYAHKAENLNDVAIPELARLALEEKPFFLFLRHMDPHSPYLPPPPFERMFYYGNEKDPSNKSMEPVMSFEPFCDYFASWMPEGITDKDYEIAQYDGALAYMDACIQNIFMELNTLQIMDDTMVIITSDHGETLYDHECWFDHHGLYDCTLHVPMIIRYPSKLPKGKCVSGYNQLKDLVPTILELAEIDAPDHFDGHSLVPMAWGNEPTHETEIYITECTWMRKHGWRTPEWKLILALEPDFHFKPPIELYNLIADPDENNNVADCNKDVVSFLKGRMDAWIERRERETGLPAPVLNQPGWHGVQGIDYFASSQQAYEMLHIGDPGEAKRLQAKKDN